MRDVRGPGLQRPTEVCHERKQAKALLDRQQSDMSLKNHLAALWGLLGRGGGCGQRGGEDVWPKSLMGMDFSWLEMAALYAVLKQPAA